MTGLAVGEEATVPYKIPVVVSAMDAVRAFAQGQPVGVPENVAVTLTNWGFHMTPAGSLPGVPLVTKAKAKHAANILSDVDYDHALNSRDPVMGQYDDQAGIAVPDLTVLLIGPSRHVSGDSMLAVIARLNPDGSPAYVNPLGVPPPPGILSSGRVIDGVFYDFGMAPPIQAAGFAGFGQMVAGVPSGRTVVATIPLPTTLASQGEFNVTAGHVLAFTGSTAGQLLGKIPFVGSGISIAQSGAELAMGEGTANQWVQFFVNIVQGGGGIAATAARVAIPALGTLQVFADFTSSDSRSIAQGIATLMTAPLAIMFGPLGGAAQQAARWITGKVYDYFSDRAAEAETDRMTQEIVSEGMREYNYAQQRAVEQGLLQQVQLESMQATTEQVFGDLAAQQAQQTQDIRDVAVSMADAQNIIPSPEVIADVTGLDVGTVSDALGVPPTPSAVMDITLTPITSAPPDITDITGQPVLPPLAVEDPGYQAPPDVVPVEDVIPVDLPPEEIIPVDVAPEVPPEAMPPVVDVTPPPAPYTGPIWPGPNVGIVIPCSWNPTLNCVVYFGEAEFYAYVQGGGSIRG
jgi:hypothetical protein